MTVRFSKESNSEYSYRPLSFARPPSDDHAPSTNDTSTLIEWAAHTCATRLDLPASPQKTAGYQNAIRLLRDYDLEPNLDVYCGNKEGFLLWQQTMDPCYYAKPLRERVVTAIELAYAPNEPETVRTSIALGSIPPLTRTVRNDEGESLLHGVAWHIGFTSVFIATKRVKRFSSEQLDLTLIGERPM